MKTGDVGQEGPALVACLLSRFDRPCLVPHSRLKCGVRSMTAFSALRPWTERCDSANTARSS